MRLSANILFSAVLSIHAPLSVAVEIDLPIDPDDYGQPNWLEIIEAAFPPWEYTVCPRLDKVGGALADGFSTFPTPQKNKFNPCYYTKAFAGLDPIKGGYPTPIDTKYPYEFAAPFLKQPGDGSTHHCPIDTPENTKIQSCPKVTPKCAGDKKDCNKITEEFRIGHVPPFVPLAAIRNAYTNLQKEEHVCQWFHDPIEPCSIPSVKLDKMILETFEVDGTIQFTPPKILDNLNATDPKSTYYKLEYLDDEVACADNNCRGPHYCSKAAAIEDVWGDFCPYIHTGENSGLYRHPHIALAALELWFASKCFPEECPSTWLDSPNGKYYGDKISTSITWAEMDDNENMIAQPKVPYNWPNSGKGIFPGHELYGDSNIKAAAGSYVTKFVARGKDSSGGSISSHSSAIGFMVLAFVASVVLSFV